MVFVAESGRWPLEPEFAWLRHWRLTRGFFQAALRIVIKMVDRPADAEPMEGFAGAHRECHFGGVHVRMVVQLSTVT